MQALIEYRQINRPLSARLMEDIKAENKQCYRNAYRATWCLKDALYVEGMAVLPELAYIAFEHAWVLYGGEVIEPTPVWLTDHKCAIYYPVLSINQADLLRVRGFPAWQYDKEQFSYYAALHARIQAETYRAIGADNIARMLDEAALGYMARNP